MNVYASVIGGFLIFQYVVLYIFSEYVPGYIAILPLDRTELIEHAASGTGKAFRARSILGEPSEIGIVIGLALFSLTDDIITKGSTSRKDYIVFLYFCFCLLLSQSGTGVGVMIFCLFYLGFKKNLIIIHYILMCLIIYILVSNLDLIKDILHVVINRAATRITGFDEFFLQSDIRRIFGNGAVGREGMIEWGGGIARIMKFYGIIGLTLFILPLLLCVKDLRSGFKVIYLIMFSVLTQLPISVWVVFVFPFIFANLSQNSLYKSSES